MAYRARRVDYFNTTIKDQTGGAYRLLSRLATGSVNLLAFTAVPIGPATAQLSLFPDDVEQLAGVAEETGLVLDGPYPALLVQGEDTMGALAEIHSRLGEANVSVFASSGVSDGKGCYGYVLYIKPDHIAAAAAALGV